MEIRYQNTHADYTSHEESLYREDTASDRWDYYYAMVWYLMVLGLGAAIAFKHEEMFVVAIFAVLAASYIRRNWSFDKTRRTSIASKVRKMAERSCVLNLDERGVAERWDGTELVVPWSAVRDFVFESNLLIINIINRPSLLIPLRYLNDGEPEKLKEMLANHRVPHKGG